MSDKIAEIPVEELQELMTSLSNCRNDKKKLIEVINFLNDEVKNYNKEYAEKVNEKVSKILNENFKWK